MTNDGTAAGQELHEGDVLFLISVDFIMSERRHEYYGEPVLILQDSRASATSVLTRYLHGYPPRRYGRRPDQPMDFRITQTKRRLSFTRPEDHATRYTA